MRPRLIMLVVLMAACSGADSASSDGGSCSCPPQTALATMYDNASSMLGAENVQDGLDELAARPLPEAPVADRIETLGMLVDNPGTVAINVSLRCPMAGDIALGGSCGILVGGALAGWTISNPPEGGLLNCHYTQPEGATDPLDLHLVCLHRQ